MILTIEVQPLDHDPEMAWLHDHESVRMCTSVNQKGDDHTYRVDDGSLSPHGYG